MRTFATMGALASFPGELITKEGASVSRVPVGLTCISGMSAPFLQPLEEWWSPITTASSSKTSFRDKAAASCHLVVQHLLFPSPLSRPPAVKRKIAVRREFSASLSSGGVEFGFDAVVQGSASYSTVGSRVQQPPSASRPFTSEGRYPPSFLHMASAGDVFIHRLGDNLTTMNGLIIVHLF